VIHQAERTFIQTLTPLLGRSPRALKRFVNVYHLIKAGLPEERQTSFLAETPGVTPDYKAVLFLLAVVTGTPDVAPAFWEALCRAGRENRMQQESSSDPVPQDQLKDLLWLLEDLDGRLGRHPEWTKVRGWLQPSKSRLRLDADLEPLIDWEPRVSRYSFRIEPAS
jgi:hypothetical protein